MLLAKIVGSVVVTQKINSLVGKKLMLAKCVSTCGEEMSDEVMVAVDTVGAGIGDLVLLSQGTPAQTYFESNSQGIDCAVVGIIDTVNNH
ncbi:EutN/CcmL family microcompartment protein [Shewanella sp. D64]|uniref:EutN/CcmL family microcompartment protein n=1 Tax=unclassified Shewanella TaxID=196818 RepID=UPI0022BA6E31|nr:MULTISPECIES: EutN/CcmL family microcompartment protein [unclassified Shewanella]MEC4725575.1 EutN/CcmL family microcompartment protein [Shewanella sp. D64]MEC4739627.1 EutN/CcmL family microcompartment protein [Shewanella sp. E94]WBJ94906.1 EutN/CcmL family microcompartment protein [Shewanella sp. MTB7]